MPVFEYDASSKRYRKPNGRFISQREAVGLRDQYVDGKKATMAAFAKDLASGDLSIQELELRLRREVKTAYLTEYMLGRGGRNAMTQKDFGIIGAQLKAQYQYLHSFMEDAKAGKLSEKQISARTALYIESASQAYERGHASSFGNLTLPHYPGDSSTECQANCRCGWDIAETETEWQATWIIEAGAEHCATCTYRAAEWVPYIVPKQQRYLRAV